MSTTTVHQTRYTLNKICSFWTQHASLLCLDSFGRFLKTFLFARYWLYCETVRQQGLSWLGHWHQRSIVGHWALTVHGLVVRNWMTSAHSRTMSHSNRRYISLHLPQHNLPLTIDITIIYGYTAKQCWLFSFINWRFETQKHRSNDTGSRDMSLFYVFFKNLFFFY